MSEIFYQIIDKETGQPVADNGMLLMSPEGIIYDLTVSAEGGCPMPEEKNYTVKITRTFRHSGLESKIENDIAEYVKRQLDECFPDGMTDELRQVMVEYTFDVFHDGMTYSEELQVCKKKERGIITGER